MSRLWSSTQLRVHLAGNALVACVVQGRGRNWTVVRKERFAFEPGQRALAMAALRNWLAPASRNARLSWVLGGTEVKYCLLPWAPELIDATLRDSFAKVLFEQQFKLDSNLFEIRCSRGLYQQALVAAFVEKDLLGQIKLHARESQRRLDTIEPAVCAVWARFAPLLRTERGVVHLIEGDRQVIAHHDRARISAVAFRPFAARGLAGLPHPLPEEKVRLFSSIPLMADPSLSGAQLFLPSRPGFDAALDTAYGFALCGAL